MVDFGGRHSIYIRTVSSYTDFEDSYYREFSLNANFITANSVTAVFQNFSDIFYYFDSMYILLM